MGRIRRGGITIFLLALLGCLGCDQLTKAYARSALSEGPPVRLVADTLRLELAYNPGALLSLGADLPTPIRRGLFLVAIPIALLALVLSLFRAGDLTQLQIVGLAAVCGGGLGNWLDRLLDEGLVTDFVSVGIGPLRTGIFNLADVAIILGVAALLLGLWRGEKAAPAVEAD